MRFKQVNMRLGVIGLILVLSVSFSYACNPLPVLLYNAEEVYQRNGWEIPDLPEDAVALVNGEYISKADFEVWLYEKIGFNPKLREKFIINRSLKRKLEVMEIDTNSAKELMFKHASQFRRNDVHTNCASWTDVAPKMEFDLDEKKRVALGLQVEETYLKTLYVLNHWEEVLALGLERFDIRADYFEIEGEDESLLEVVQLNNAYAILKMYSSLIDPHLRKVALSGEDMNLPKGTKEYREWLYTNYRTVYLLETYLGMMISAQYAEQNDLRVSEKVAQLECEKRELLYQGVLDTYNEKLPAVCVAMDFSPVYAGFIRSEVIDDLSKSMAYRKDRPLKPHEIRLRYYKQYGYEGQRCKVNEVYRWVKKRNRPGRALPGQKEYAIETEVRVRSELNAIRDQILSDGVDSFYEKAMVENHLPLRQFRAGLSNIRDAYGSKFESQLNEMALNEISPVEKATPYTMGFFWLAEQRGTNRVYYGISKALPTAPFFDFKKYQAGCATVREELEDLKDQAEAGASILELAKEFSDNFDLTRGDLSTTYQSVHGFRFAQKIHSIPDGGFDVVQSDDGFHLVQVVSREITPLSSALKETLLQQYYHELAFQNERYVLAKKRFDEVNPYFK